MKPLSITALLLSLSVLAPLTATADDFGVRFGPGGVSIGIDLGAPPPPPRVQVVPVTPAGYIWAPGYWAWDGYRYVWVEGSWVAERPGFAYIPGGWERRGERWHFEPGRWEEHRREEAFRGYGRHGEEHYQERRYEQERWPEHRYEERRHEERREDYRRGYGERRD